MPSFGEVRESSSSPRRRDDTLRVSAVVCAYTEQRWGDILKAVASLQEQTYPLEEVILVVDHHPDLQRRLRLEFEAGQGTVPVIVTANRHVRGLSGARNTGVEQSRGTVVAFLDDDAFAEPTWLERLVAHFRDPHVLGAGGRVIPAWENGAATWFPEEFYWALGCSYRGLPAVAAPVRNLFGGCMVVRRQVFLAAGGFREGIGRAAGLPLGCEETELCIRAAHVLPQGRFLYEPTAAAHHRVPRSRVTWRYLNQRCYAEGRSKALVSQLWGSRDALATERGYARRTLTSGVGRSLADAFTGHGPTALLRAAAIAVGLAAAAVGYARGRLVRARVAPEPSLIEAAGSRS